MLVPFPYLQKKFGTGTVLWWCAIVYPFDMALWVVGNELLRADATLAFWIVMPTINVVGSGIAMSFGKITCLHLAICVTPND